MSLVRLDKLMSTKGYATRRETGKLIYQGRITLKDPTGVKTLKPDSKVESSNVLFDGAEMDPDVICIIMNKPQGAVCSHKDSGQLIYELLNERFMKRSPVISTVGRLDRDTTGCILFTDDGGLLHRLTSPKSKTEKVYRVCLEKDITQDDIALIENGGMILPDDKPVPLLPAKCQTIDSKHVILTLLEGRYHQVKRMFEVLGNNVTELHRVSFADLSADDLPLGQWRFLTDKEIEHLKSL